MSEEPVGPVQPSGMKVSELIEILSKHSPDDQVAVYFSWCMGWLEVEDSEGKSSVVLEYYSES